jgi:hypothetical protein
MRRAVKRPSHPATTTPKIASTNTALTTGERSLRAQATSKSPYIHRYTSNHQAHIIKKTAPLTVQEPPKKDVAKPSTVSTPAARPAHAHTQTTSKSEVLFNKALQNAETPKKHAQKHRKHSKTTKRASIASGLAAAALLVGFITYLNWPNFNLRLASSQAGFSAEMPGYQPAGYSFKGPIDYTAGKVTINFKSNTDDRSYSIKQEVSNWNSQSLQDNFLTAQNKTYEVQQEAGRTIYLYDNGQATWVNGGVWYQLDGSSLSPDQLMKVASSL